MMCTGVLRAPGFGFGGTNCVRSRRLEGPYTPAGEAAPFRAVQERGKACGARRRNSAEIVNRVQRQNGLGRPFFADEVAWLCTLGAVRAIEKNVCTVSATSVMGSTVVRDSTGTRLKM